MRRLQYLVASTLDGRIAREDGAFDCFGPVGEEHVPDYLAMLRTYDAVIMGRKTYEVGLRAGVTDPYPGLDTYVFSRTLGQAPKERVKVISDDPVEFTRNLKRQPGGGIYLCGGAQLAATLLEAGLIDDLILKLNPFVLGSGIPLFAKLNQPVYWQLAETKRYGNGVLLLTYSQKG